MTPTVLLGELDERTVKTISSVLIQQRGCNIVWEKDGESLIRRFEAANGFQAIIISTMLYKMNGCYVCGRLRKMSNVPIIMLTNTLDDRELQACFSSGADVCLNRPVSPKLLLARFDNLLWRSGYDCKREKLFCNGLLLDYNRHILYLDGNPVSLPPRQLDLLYYLMRNRGIVLTRAQLLQNVWQSDYDGNERTLDTHIKCLRNILGKYRDHIVTLRKVGYKFI